MVHSVELLFDADTEARLRQVWDELDAADLPSRLPAGRPHVTVAVAERIAPDVDELLLSVARKLPVSCSVGAPVFFGQSNAVLARLIVPTAELLALHADVHRICGPFLLPGPLPRSLPGQWTAHVTLARRIERAQLGPVLRLAGQPPDIHGRLAALRRWDGTARVEYPIG
ncbi:2'-5' RNA ligase family protein [Mycobacterium paraterrae]|uniref:2'-5' RNA ligase family protein n=1 Tax=Mycobacterium paraterrae TaxID=577492 RepID=A0ABY3VDH2_9MYCO|nr:2'-5' RNA ligase family protein [Mycobacterium paraterrae]UMB67496.1 2'-5' RNA ligase family protein [Mycobacterium paraterrae]